MGRSRMRHRDADFEAYLHINYISKRMIITKKYIKANAYQKILRKQMKL